MKARVQSIEDLKKAASKELEAEFSRRYQEATLEGALQGMAFVMYTLEMCKNWKHARQKQLFEDMLSIMQLSEATPWMQAYRAPQIKEHIEKEYGIDFNLILSKIEATPPDC